MWFFPSEKGLRGYEGTGRIWFVGQRPSLNGKKKPFEGFYTVVNGHPELHNAHFTDIVKKRSKTKSNLSPSEVESEFHFFKEEVRILKPLLIVALGWDAYRILRKKRLGEFPNVMLVQICHYGFRWQAKGKTMERVKSEIGSIATIARGLRQ